MDHFDAFGTGNTDRFIEDILENIFAEQDRMMAAEAGAARAPVERQEPDLRGEGDPPR